MPDSLLRRACPTPSSLLHHDFDPAEIDPVTLAERQGLGSCTPQTTRQQFKNLGRPLGQRKHDTDLHPNPPISHLFLSHVFFDPLGRTH
jgi:hypothetical protein